MEQGSIVLKPEEISEITSGSKTLEVILIDREAAKVEKAKADDSWRAHLAERQDRMKRAVETGNEKGIINIGLKYDDLLIKDFDCRKQSDDFVNWKVVPIKGQFDWFSEAGIYYDTSKDDFFYVSSKKYKGTWVQRIFPLTERGFDLAVDLASDLTSK